VVQNSPPFVPSRQLGVIAKETVMNMGKTLAASAVSGILVGVLAGCGGETKEAGDPKAPSTDMAPRAAKDCCKGKNECKERGRVGAGGARQRVVSAVGGARVD
jgi:hypothetical protein